MDSVQNDLILNEKLFEWKSYSNYNWDFHEIWGRVLTCYWEQLIRFLAIPQNRYSVCSAPNCIFPTSRAKIAEDIIIILVSLCRDCWLVSQHENCSNLQVNLSVTGRLKISEFCYILGWIFFKYSHMAEQIRLVFGMGTNWPGLHY